MLKIGICDDEAIMAENIKNIVNENFKNLNIENEIKTFTRGELLLNYQDINKIDILFLDIELKTINGINLAKELREKGYENLIIFITSFANYSIVGYKVDAFRFILKDNLKEELIECTNSIVSKLGLKKLPLNDLNVEIKDIIYIESVKHKIIIHIKNKEDYVIYDTLDNIEKILNSEHLIRVHKSYLVNILYIKEIKCYDVSLVDNIDIPIPKNRYGEVKKKFNIKRTLWR